MPASPNGGSFLVKLYYANVTNNPRNTGYPNVLEISNTDDFAKVIRYDHVAARYKDFKTNSGRVIKGHRAIKDFISSDCLMMDCDNTSSDPLKDVPSSEWKKPEDVATAFPDVPFYVCYSKNHMKEKDGKTARPRFHIYFPLSKDIDDVKYYGKLKEQALALFPAFDANATDGARFFFGVAPSSGSSNPGEKKGAKKTKGKKVEPKEEPKETTGPKEEPKESPKDRDEVTEVTPDNAPMVEYHKGEVYLDLFLRSVNTLPEVIQDGERNDTLHRFAVKYLKRYGDGQRARSLFEEACEHCQSPLDSAEQETIWKSAQKFFNETIKTDPNYKEPDDFTDDSGKGLTTDDIRKVMKDLGITVKDNLITNKIFIEGLPDVYTPSKRGSILPGFITDELTRREQHMSRLQLDEAIFTIADENKFNPVEDMLKSATWDGEDRINVLGEILGVADEAQPMTLLTKWLHQSIALALNDDVKPFGADGVLVLQGKQGTGKTMFCRKLAVRPEWFAEGTTLDTSNKDSIIKATSVWINELGELDSTFKKEQSALKAFITQNTDTYRMPYAREAISRPRRTSFCGTVNPNRFLIDDTGNRRYWVIQPKEIDLARLKGLDEGFYKQLWRQVYETLYLPNPQGFRLTSEEQKQLGVDNEGYAKGLPGEVEVLDKLNWDAPLNKWNWNTTTQLREEMRLFSFTSAQIGRVLTKLVDTIDDMKVKEVSHKSLYFTPPAMPYGMNSDWPA